jgi:hypothetical protein
MLPPPAVPAQGLCGRGIAAALDATQAHRQGPAQNKTSTAGTAAVQTVQQAGSDGMCNTNTQSHKSGYQPSTKMQKDRMRSMQS